MTQLNDLRHELLRTIGRDRTRSGGELKKLAAAIKAVNDKTQRVNTSVGPLSVGVPVDVTIIWPQAWPDTGYGVWVQLATGAAALGDVHATLKAGTKTTTDCVVTVVAVAVVATIGVDVLGVRT